MISHEKNGAAIDASRKADADRLLLRQMREPLRDLLRKRPIYASPIALGIGRQNRGLRFEESRVNRIGIGAANQFQARDVVRRHHPRIARMELFAEAFRIEPLANRVDPMGHHEHWPGRALGEEVPHRPIERPRHFHRLAFARDERERTLNLTRRFGASENQFPRILNGQIVDLIRFRFGQIHHALDIFFRHRLTIACLRNMHATETPTGKLLLTGRSAPVRLCRDG